MLTDRLPGGTLAVARQLSQGVVFDTQGVALG
jgi:hypothetical protein